MTTRSLTAALAAVLLAATGARAEEVISAQATPDDSTPPIEEPTPAVVPPPAPVTAAPAEPAPPPVEKTIVVTPAPIVVAPAPAPAPAPQPARPQPEPVVQPTPAPATTPPAPTEPPTEAKLARPSTSVFVRTNPLALAATGSTIGGHAAWHPDLLTLGLGFGKLEFMASLTAQNLFPELGEPGARYGRFSALFRPLRSGEMPVLDAYVYAGVGFGGVGTYDGPPVCLAVTECPGGNGKHFSRYGGDLHGGVGLDFHKELFTLPSGQVMYFFAAIDMRPTVVLNGPDGAAQFFMVYSLPVGIRWN